MTKPWRWKSLLANDLWLLVLAAALRVALQAFTNAQYGFFRDELVVLDDARQLQWGFVAYPPFTPFLGWIGLSLFGSSLNGIRFVSVLAQGVVMLLAGLMVRAMGGKRWAQMLAAAAVGTSPLSIVNGTVLQYTVFDCLWWVLAAYFIVRLLQSEDARWWLGVGASLGFGLLTKYTIVFLGAGIVFGTLCTKSRHYLKSVWFWGGVAVMLLIATPNLLWQIHHGFVSLSFLRSIHARDVGLGRDRGFLLDQIKFNGNVITVGLIIAGIYFCLFSPIGRRYRSVGLTYFGTLALLVAAKGRPYYLSPAYPILIAAGARWTEERLSRLTQMRDRLVRRVVGGVLAAGALCVVGFTLPVAPINTPWWRLVSFFNENLKEEIGWHELVETIARIEATLPMEEKPGTAILAGNGGEAGAINLFGPACGLPRAISGFNSSWERGYGNPPPRTLIVIGFSADFLRDNFESCLAEGSVTNRYGIQNQETTNCPVVYVCRGLREPWPEFWRKLRCYG